MDWTGFNHFLEMGGYAIYVWPSWGLTAIILIAHYLFAKHANTRIRKQLIRQQSRAEKLTTANTPD